MKNKNRRVQQIVKQAFERLKIQNPSISVRALASKLGVSHVFVGKLLNGESPLPVERLHQIATVFQLDELSLSSLKEAIAEQNLGESLANEIKKQEADSVSPAEVYSEFSGKYFTLIEHWYELPLLDLLTCENEDTSAAGLARRLGITEAQAQSAVRRLSELGLIHEENLQWKKSTRYIRLPSKIPRQITRDYYTQVLQKAQNELKKSKQEDFDLRSITNLSIAIDPKNLAVAKERLQKLLYQLSLELSEGEAREVYFLTTALFPVTRKI